MGVFRRPLVPTETYFMLKPVGVNKLVNQLSTVLTTMPMISYGTIFRLKHNRFDYEINVQKDVVNLIYKRDDSTKTTL